jgi:DNA polymerase II small subunit
MHTALNKRVLELLTSHGTLVSPDTVKYILTKADPENYVKDTMQHFHELPLFLTVDLLKSAEMKAQTTQADPSMEENLATSTNTSAPSQEPPEQPSEVSISEPTTIKSSISKKARSASDYESKIEILKDVTGESTSEGNLTDFVKYFKDRFETLRKILTSNRREAMGTDEIARIRNQQGPIKFIGLVTEVRQTKNGHKLIELEDETDSISVLINNSSPLINTNLVNDEVICVIGKMGKSDLVYVEDIVRPEVPLRKNQNRSAEPINCLFISDIHIGSNTFLNDPWNKFIKWLNGEYTHNGYEDILDRLKYIVVAGDIVDGIGIYPGQEAELEIADIYAQYEELARRFQNIPEHLKLIIQPGNHDAVRPAEPQPTFPKEITNLFNNDVHFVGNPCYFTLNGVEILSYHGRSMDDFVMQIPNVSYNQPLKIMKEMLIRRHLAPVYGQKTPIAPEHHDYLLIDRLPDIFVTGHIHKTAVETFRDISLINASAWQSQTKYQKMMNFNPEPGNVISADLQTGKLSVINFT